MTPKSPTGLPELIVGQVAGHQFLRRHQLPNLPVRDLARGGVIRDVHPDAVPITAWSNGRNIGFINGKTYRAPIWRRVQSGLGGRVKHCAALHPSSGFDRLVVVRDDHSAAVYQGGTVTSLNETGWTAAASSTAPWSSAYLGDILYINRSDRAPRALLPGASNLVTLPNWPSTWRANCIRQYQDTILALGLTQGAAPLPTQINISDIAYFGQVPGSWDTTDPTKLAYSNDLAQLDGPILDGLVLGDRFLFYTAHQCWEMRAGGNFLYSFRKLFGDTGIIATNCVVEAGGLHYVLGTSDIYVTDGNTKRSLADGRVREWLYRTASKNASNNFFVQHLPQTNEVLFGYTSGDPACAWKNPTECNSGLAYNITTDTWAPIDLPNVAAMALCNLNGYLAWNTTAGRTWSGVGGSWYDQESTRAIHAVAINNPLSTPYSISEIGGGSCILGYDFTDRGQLAFEADLSCCAPSFVERTGITLDTMEQGQAPLNIAKTIRTIYPEVTISRPVALTIQVGCSMTPSGPVDWEDPVTFDPINDYYVNSRSSGRYLALRLFFDPLADTEVTGFDIDVVANGRR